MLYITKKENLLKFFITLLVPILMIMLKPMSMTLNQNIVLGSLFLVIIWWGTGIVHKNVASIFLICMFIIFGTTPLEKVFFFPLSDNLILVVASYLLSQGIINSKVADKFAEFVLRKYCHNSTRLVIMSYILGIVLIFVIPQPFPRVIILSSIYLNFLKNTGADKEDKSIMLFSVFVASTVTSLLFLNGDIIINNAAQGFGGISISYFEWAIKMTIPTLITTILIAIVFILVFKKNLTYEFEGSNEEEKMKIGTEEKKALSITFIIILLWLTETFHGISAANVALIGILAMFASKIISLKDLKATNISLLIFLTAEFAIGKVIVGSGVAEKLSVFLTKFFPASNSMLYIPFIIFLIMLLHMIMGSLITALSVTIPTLITITAGVLSPELIVLLVCASVCFHYLMPFHHVTIMLGYGNEYYDNKHVLKLGVYLTLITLFSVLFIYLPWWKIIGVI